MNKPLSPSETLSDWAQRGAALGDCGKMCNSCAFRQGSEANSEPHNVEGALQALAWEGQFNCHPEGGHGDAGKVCVGFLYAKQYLQSKYQDA